MQISFHGLSTAASPRPVSSLEFHLAEGGLDGDVAFGVPGRVFAFGELSVHLGPRSRDLGRGVGIR